MKLKPIFIAIFFICAIFSLANVSAQDSNNLNSSEIQDTDNIETFTLNGEIQLIIMKTILITDLLQIAMMNM